MAVNDKVYDSVRAMVNDARKMYVRNYPVLTISDIAKYFGIIERTMYSYLKNWRIVDKSYREPITEYDAIQITKKMMYGGVSAEQIEQLLTMTYDVRHCGRQRVEEQVSAKEIVKRAKRLNSR